MIRVVSYSVKQEGHVSLRLGDVMVTLTVLMAVMRISVKRRPRSVKTGSFSVTMVTASSTHGGVMGTMTVWTSVTRQTARM